ncbi:MAG: YicC family protein [Thermoplasmata archaeon]|nr:MAG: YicC family protein [Thermoplasmata archaeon]
MTAYGRGEYQEEDRLFVAELRSLNNRYRDIVLRIPRNYQALEQELKSAVASRVKRGRVEVSVQVDNTREELPHDLELNLPLVRSYLRIFDQLAEEFGLQGRVSSEVLCQMEDVIVAKPQKVELEEVRPGLLKALGQALDSLDEMRTREGKAIEADFQKRLARLEQYLSQIHERAPQLVAEYRQRLQKGIEQMVKEVMVDEGRLAQEVAFFAERSNITEEIVRIRSHLNQFRVYLSGAQAVGRRLDFLIQEINREVNTLSAKSSDSYISGIVVEMKAELEKLREQVQNIE